MRYHYMHSKKEPNTKIIKQQQTITTLGSVKFNKWKRASRRPAPSTNKTDRSSTLFHRKVIPHRNQYYQHQYFQFSLPIELGLDGYTASTWKAFCGL
ncbi:hypothetical protein [Chromobacterium sp. ASV23]|uniref:hypothetical protein n=1 Tax=Chromobacterium sp. ASV23 TaxID=2795110 RepID=UPI0018EAFBE4|nr:hypothetical protein [Chromobacterium sp. ASV23]